MPLHGGEILSRPIFGPRRARPARLRAALPTGREGEPQDARHNPNRARVATGSGAL